MAFGPPGAAAALRYAGREPLERLTPRHARDALDGAARPTSTASARRGYALDAEEHELGVGCVAHRRSSATTGPARRGDRASPGRPTRILHGDTHELGALLGRHAAEISAVLGHARRGGLTAGPAGAPLRHSRCAVPAD